MASIMASREELIEAYPQLAFLVDIPEIFNIMQQAQTENWTSTKFQAKIQATGWWRSTNEHQRKALTQQSTDPASWTRALWSMADQVKQIGFQLGFHEGHLTPQYIEYFARKALENGLSTTQIRQMLGSEITKLIGATEMSPHLWQVRKLSQDYFQQFNLDEQNYWLENLATGNMTLENLEASMKMRAKDQFRHLADQIDAGATMAQIAQPYKQQISQLLEVGEDQIDFKDAKYRHMLDYVDPKDGNHRTMSLQEAGKYIRGMHEWKATSNAQETAAEMGNKLLESMGAL